VVGSDGECINNTVLSAMPFLRIAPDARGGAMGDVGVAMTPDVNSIHYNASSLVFAKETSGASISYTPWLRNLGIDDIFLLYLSSYYKLDENQTIAGSVRYFSLGDIEFRDNQGGSLGTGTPREGEFTLAYARKLGDNFSASLSGKYMFSRLASGLSIQGQDIITARSFAADIGLNYRKKANIGGYKSEVSYGLAMTNIGSKVQYISGSDLRDFVPTNFAFGSAIKLNLDNYNTLSIGLDFNKLMIPSPVSRDILIDGKIVPNPKYDANTNGIADYREKPLFSGMSGSFADAQGGFAEELQEISWGLGLEYWYDNQFSFRGGYYHESTLKGNRRYFTVGAGVKYNVFGINLSYLVPTSTIPNPLDNTLRFSLLFDFSVFNADE